MSSKSLAPPERNTLSEEPKRPPALLGSADNLEHGQQLSTFTEIKQGKRSGNLFVTSDSPLQP
jgi:hypothetical protein